jgi:hypothetical protein
MRSGVATIAAVILLCGCTTNPVPEGYTGPVAKVTDSYNYRSDTAYDFFVVTKVNGKRIEDSLSTTAGANYGHGFAMRAFAIGRKVPAEEATFTVMGRTHYAAPILEMLNPVYEITGDIRFTPLPNHDYYVEGKMDDDHSVIWIRDNTTRQQVADKIEIKGSTRVGLLQK